MSFYRTIIAVVAALGLSTAVFAADENANANPVQAADATPAAQSSQPAADQQQPAQDQSAQGQQAPAADQAKVDVNKASAKDLMKVKGISAAKAKAIVAYRKKHGDFKSLDDLKMVKGFKKMNEEQLKSIQDQLTTG